MLRIGKSQCTRDPNRLQQTACVRSTGSGNIEGRSVVRTGAYQGQTQGHVDAFFNAQILHRNQTLVVVHGHHHIEFTPHTWLVARTHKDRIRRPRATHHTTLRLRRSHGRCNHLDFFPPKKAALPRMRIESRHGDARPAPEQALQVRVGDAQRLAHGD